ncbi:zinc finger protein Xfin [Leguminivora glycinivorella]|uniref:zinc finger protein Xfin n=1 Tax=Leguminivora glycinivorella TaxID=1035111 RepID=UPI00200BEDAA|nr:zinc finger protein Xfin [Leguminivora glycinivorella]
MLLSLVVDASVSLMLSPRDDDDDDSHLCIRCNATIIGLDNYVKHRKERCSKSKPQPKVEIAIDPLEPTYNLGADVFFQSLELQSSVKKTSLSRLTPPIPISKANLDRKNVLVVASTSCDIRTMSPVESNFRGGDWIGGHSLRIGVNEDNQTKLINAVASISGAVKKEIPTSYSIGPYNDFKPDDESDETEDSDDEDEEEPPSGGKWKPPPNYTGGKWRPASPDHEEWIIRDEQEHTGGKWRPIMADANDRDEDYDAPPPGHTKGKWVPGAHEKSQIMQTTIQRKGSVLYWCGPCNRRLGSRAIYEKHLLSKLHMKKVLPENELEFSGHLQPLRSTVEQSSRKLRSVSKPEPSKSILKTELEKKKKRKRKLLFVNCPGCKSRVRQHLMGKHLISHYHFRKASTVHNQVYRQLIVDNIDVIVHQSPFQCSPCKFYTNWLSNFMQHWSSEEHSQVTSSMEGRHWCSFCKFECETSMDMLLHLSGAEHSEVVAVINRSMPIIIRKKSILKCETCYREFRFNAEIRRHCKLTGHQLTYTATDEYQELHNCQQCALKFKSSLTLAAHLKSVHNQKAHMCLVCSRTFCSADEAKQHRNTSEHRLRRKANMKARGLPVKEVSKKCPYCIEKKTVLANVLELKNHIRSMHPNNKTKCPKCGMSFTLPQEVTRHIRSNACQFRNWLAPTSNHQLWNCSQCLFTTDSQAECFFHEVLHTAPVKEVHRVDGQDKIILKYRCPLCPKNFRKSSLRHHLRQHTCERPFVCKQCGANFTRKSSLVNHVQKEHVTPKVKEEKVVPVKGEKECRRCKRKFPNAREHFLHPCLAANELLCPYEQCNYVASTRTQYTKHHATHGVQLKHLSCPKCSFRTNQNSHLKRHLICHEARKPYKCPHCEFTCASLENLRKHALKRAHKALPLYMCAGADCTFGTNTATELRSHLVLAHGDLYDSRTAVEAVRKHLMTE